MAVAHSKIKLYFRDDDRILPANVIDAVELDSVLVSIDMSYR